MRTLLFSLLVAVSVVGCQSPEAGEAGEAGGEGVVDEDSADLTQGSASENSTFFQARRDFRKCASPMCGGYFVSRVNRATTTCPEGGKAAECYVPTLNLDKTGLDDGEKSALEGALAEGRALVRANLGKKKINGSYFNTLNVSEGWLGRGPSAPTGTFYRVKLNGVRCITWPCPTLDEAKLNSSITGSLAGLDLGTSGADDKALEAGSEALVAGLLVAGVHTTITGPAGSANQLAASQFYTRVVHQACDPDKAAVDHWSAGVGDDTVVVQVGSEKEGTSHVDPEGRSVRWIARTSTADGSVSYVVGINDLWAQRFDIHTTTCALTVTAEH